MADGEADWESEDFEPTVFKKPLLHTDRWAGEDEDEEVKDNWYDEEEEEKEEEEEEEEKPEPQIVAVQPKKKKPLSQTIAEKERKEKEERERLKQLEQEKRELTPEEKLAQKLKQQKLQEEADLELAKETFGVTDSTTQSIDQMKPSSKEDFDIYRKLLVEKIQKSEESPHFITFLEDLFRDLCINVQAEDIKKFTSTMTALMHEKIKAQKAKSKKKSKKATLNVGKEDDFTIIDYVDEYEDCI